MAVLSITAASVVGSGTINSSYATKIIQVGEAVTQGQVLYKKSADSKFWKMQADGTAEESGYNVEMAVAMSAASANQLIVGVTSGTIVIGATVVAGTPYYANATAGAIGLFGDLSSTNYVTQIGKATSTTVISINFDATGITLA